MKFNYSLVFFLQRETSYKYQEYLYSSFKSEYYCCHFLTKKPLIGFEPMTYALPWRYSTTELKGLHLSQFPNKEPSNMDMSLVHLFVTAYTQIIYIE